MAMCSQRLPTGTYGNHNCLPSGYIILLDLAVGKIRCSLGVSRPDILVKEDTAYIQSTSFVRHVVSVK